MCFKYRELNVFEVMIILLASLLQQGRHLLVLGRLRELLRLVQLRLGPLLLEVLLREVELLLLLVQRRLVQLQLLELLQQEQHRLEVALLGQHLQQVAQLVAAQQQLLLFMLPLVLQQVQLPPLATQPQLVAVTLVVASILVASTLIASSLAPA